MKIAIIGTFPPYRGGIAHFNKLLHDTLNKEHDVIAINFYRQYPKIFFPGKSQIEQNYDIKNSFNNTWLDSINPFSWFRVIDKLKAIKPDLIIYKFWMPFFAPALGTISHYIKKHINVKSICIVDNLIPHETRLGDNILIKYLVNNTDAFLVMSKEVRDDLLFVKSNADFCLTRHPVYTQFGNPIDKNIARKNLEIKENKVILYFGFIRKYKGVQYLIRAIPKVINKIDARFIIAGEFYDNRDKYIKEIDKITHSDKLTLVDGFIADEQVNNYFSAADIVVLPYIDATQSGITQIALNYELPCIVTNVGGLPEIVHDGETGFVIEPESSNAISKSIIKYYKNSDREKFRKFLTLEKNKYSWNNFAQKLIKLYESCL